MKSYECEGQLSLFDGFLDNEGYKKPAIGTNIVFMLDGNEYPCIVDSHCGYDMFWVRFTDRKPHDDDENIYNTDGWHLSLRGYGNSWKYESDQKPKEKTPGTGAINRYLRYGPHTLIPEVREETREYLEKNGVPDWVKWDKESLPCENCTWFDGNVCRGGSHTNHYEFGYLICDIFYQSIVERKPKTVGEAFPMLKCKHSNHRCNKYELWKIAETLDEVKCPQTCCRQCKEKLCGARCNGSEEPKAAVEEKPIQQPCGRPCDVEWCSKDCFSDQEEAETKTEKQEPQPLDIRGLCDDGYCPNCDHAFDQYLHPNEIDCEVCPECGTPLDWRVWHLKNDPKLKDKYPDLDTRYINPDTKEIENHPFEWKYTDTNPPKIEDIYFGCIVSKDNDGEDMYTYTTIRFMDGVYWIFNHPHKEWETLEKGNKGNTVIAWREYTSSELKTIRDYDSMVIYEIEEEEEEEKPAPKKKESKRASKKATKKKTEPKEEEEKEDGERDQEDM